MLLGSTCMVNGTGYLVSRQVIQKAGGWNFLLITEDVEFNAWCIQHKIRIGYCEKAVFYDTQPLTYEDSWNQRVRWTRGFFDVYRRYAPGLAHGLVKRELGLGAFDMLMSNMAPFAVTACAAIAYGVVFLLSFTSLSRMRGLLKGLFRAIGRILIILTALGFFTTAEQWNQIDAPWYKKIGYTFLFPFYLFTYAPVSIAALTRPVEWKQTDHATKDEQAACACESSEI
jgi:cellulose synthase/poly-beta-1,6-N-acetylglucosamine synthase-like glycosyltransferase